MLKVAQKFGESVTKMAHLQIIRLILAFYRFIEFVCKVLHDNINLIFYVFVAILRGGVLCAFGIFGFRFDAIYQINGLL